MCRTTIPPVLWQTKMMFFFEIGGATPLSSALSSNSLQGREQFISRGANSVDRGVSRCVISSQINGRILKSVVACNQLWPVDRTWRFRRYPTGGAIGKNAVDENDRSVRIGISEPLIVLPARGHIKITSRLVLALHCSDPSFSRPQIVRPGMIQ